MHNILSHNLKETGSKEKQIHVISLLLKELQYDLTFS